MLLKVLNVVCAANGIEFDGESYSLFKKEDKMAAEKAEYANAVYASVMAEYQEKVSMIKEFSTKLGLKNVKPLLNDGTKYNPDFENKFDFIDSASMMSYYGFSLYTVLGPAENIKITTPSDYYIFRSLTEVKENQQIFGI